MKLFYDSENIENLLTVCRNNYLINKQHLHLFNKSKEGMRITIDNYYFV